MIDDIQSIAIGPEALMKVRKLKASLALQIAKSGNAHLLTPPDPIVNMSDIDAFYIYCIDGATKASTNSVHENEPFIRAMEIMIKKNVKPSEIIAHIGIEAVSNNLETFIPQLGPNLFPRLLNVFFACGGKECEGSVCIAEPNPHYQTPKSELT